VRGLLADLPRKNCSTLAEHAGDASPDGMQHLLARAVWAAEALRDDARALLVDHLGDPGAVLVVDQTGDLKVVAAAPAQAATLPSGFTESQFASGLTRGHAAGDKEPCLAARSLRDAC
jgi:hypothetical protein